MTQRRREDMLDKARRVGIRAPREDLPDGELEEVIRELDAEKDRLIKALVAEENPHRAEDSAKLTAVLDLLKLANKRLQDRQFVSDFEDGIASSGKHSWKFW